MPRKKQRKRKPEEEYTRLAIRISRYDARVNASVNHYAYEPQYAWDLNDNDPVYQFTAKLQIAGMAIDPPNRTRETYEITIYGDDAPSRDIHATLKDVQARAKLGAPQYRQYRGRQIPVFSPPSGLGLLN